MEEKCVALRAWRLWIFQLAQLAFAKVFCAMKICMSGRLCVLLWFEIFLVDDVPSTVIVTT